MFSLYINHASTNLLRKPKALSYLNLCLSFSLWGSFTFEMYSVTVPYTFYILSYRLEISIHVLTHVFATVFACQIGKFRLRRWKSSREPQNWERSICLTTHTTWILLESAVCLRYYLPHTWNFGLSQNQILFYKEMIKNENIVLSSIIRFVCLQNL